MEVTLCGIPKRLVDYETVSEMLRPVGTVSFARFEPNVNVGGTYNAIAVLRTLDTDGYLTSHIKNNSYCLVSAPERFLEETTVYTVRRANPDEARKIPAELRVAPPPTKKCRLLWWVYSSFSCSIACATP